jgi:hypothetical protein
MQQQWWDVVGQPEKRRVRRERVSRKKIKADEKVEKS